MLNAIHYECVFINHYLMDCTLLLFLFLYGAHAALLITLFLSDCWKQFARWEYRGRGCDIVPLGNTDKTRIIHYYIAPVNASSILFITTSKSSFLLFQHLIDLAGSESSKTETTGLRRKEGSYINKSLLTLGTVILCQIFACLKFFWTPFTSCDPSFKC